MFYLFIYLQGMTLNARYQKVNVAKLHLLLQWLNDVFFNQIITNFILLFNIYNIQ